MCWLSWGDCWLGCYCWICCPSLFKRSFRKIIDNLTLPFSTRNVCKTHQVKIILLFRVKRKFWLRQNIALPHFLKLNSRSLIVVKCLVLIFLCACHMWSRNCLPFRGTRVRVVRCILFV